MKKAITTLPYTLKILSGSIAVLLILMPFHAGLVILFGHFFGYQEIWQSWKEFLVLILGGVWILACYQKRRLLIKLDATNLLFLAIVGLSVTVTLFAHPLPAAVLFGIKTNLVALALFFIAQAPFEKLQLVRARLPRLVLGPALLVAGLALLQSFVIPPEWLGQLGYSLSTINPAQIVDGSLKFYRAFASLGGPNQLGAYLIIPAVFALVYGARAKNYWLLGSTLLFLAASVVTYSRSSWLGMILALIVAVLLILKGWPRRIFVIFMSIVVVIAAGVVVWTFNEPTSPLQNILLHGRYFENRIEGSDQTRLQALTETTKKIVEQPLGHGLGSAGPASFKAQTVVIPENWYLQIAYEIGIVGLLLYICAFGWLMVDLWKNRASPLGASLFAATAGILLVNMFLHTWADSTLVLIMFSLYGLYKGQAK